MANHENEKQDRITEEDISAAYGDLKTHHEQTPLTREQMEDALNAAVRDLNRCTVAITTMFEQSEIDNVSFEDLRPGTGVLVETAGVHGIVTAAHVLAGKDKIIRYQNGRCTIGVLPLQDPKPRSTERPYFRIRQRQCLAYGVSNREVKGPDIAYIPLTPREWALMEPDGVRAWTALEEPNPDMPRNTKEEILLDCCVGPNHKATRRLQEAHPEIRPAIAFQGLQILELAQTRTEVGNWDYTRLTLEGDDKEGSTEADPRQRPEQTYRDFLDYEWHKLQPKDMLGGLSGTGLWTTRIRVNKNGEMNLHTKRLKGILFYAGPSLEATLHGRKSIERIITEGLDLHGQAAADEADALKQKTSRS